MAAAADFTLLRCRAAFQALRAARFPEVASNRFRGALGLALPESCFRPSGDAGPSGFRDRPRPFVLRATDLDCRTVEEGRPFHLGIHIFFDAPAAPFRDALAGLGWAELTGWDVERVRVKLDGDLPARLVRVEFLTPTELKPAPDKGALPAFSVLVSRIWERISALRAFYGTGPLDLDFSAMARRSAMVSAVSGELAWRRASRLSTRSGAVHPLGGFTGWAEYQGALGEFLPWLKAGFYAGVGRQTVWGKGVIGLKTLE